MKIIRIFAVTLVVLSLTACSDFMSGKSNNLFGSGDKDCDDIRKKIWVGNNDPHNLDGDGDGWACESYG